jgi:hypothetical protein
MLDNKSVRAIAALLLTKINYRGDFIIQELTLGRNNKVVKLKTPKKNFILKIFYENLIDERDRYSAETRFYDYIGTKHIDHSSQCLARSQSNRAILLDFIEGEHLTSSEITEAAFAQMMDFICALNDEKKSRPSLPMASESCFSDYDHIYLVDCRIKKLSAKVQDRSAAKFISDLLIPSWHHIREEARKTSKNWKIPLTVDERCISPSDFGFHNCVRRPNGTLAFYDFEYAGWDDPAKLICDIFCQVEVPVPLKHFPIAIERIESKLKTKRLADHVNWLMPTCRIKWCCILLNEFITIEAKRRHFSGRIIDEKALNRQLEMATAVLVTARTNECSKSEKAS